MPPAAPLPSCDEYCLYNPTAGSRKMPSWGGGGKKCVLARKIFSSVYFLIFTSPLPLHSTSFFDGAPPIKKKGGNDKIFPPRAHSLLPKLHAAKFLKGRIGGGVGVESNNQVTYKRPLHPPTPPPPPLLPMKRLYTRRRNNKGS